MQVLSSECQEDATTFLVGTLAWFKRHRVTVQRVVADNGLAVEAELVRIVDAWGHGRVGECRVIKVLASLSHEHCLVPGHRPLSDTV